MVLRDCVEGDSVAEVVELGEKSIALSVGVAAGEVVPTEVVVVSIVAEQVPTDHQDGVADGDGGLLPIRRASHENWADR